MAGAPFFGFAPTRQLPGALEGLGGVLQGLGDIRQQQLFGQDLQNLQNLAPGAQFNPRNQLFQQLQAEQLLQAQAPQSPLDIARMGLIGAQTGEAQARTEALGIPTPPDPLSETQFKAFLGEKIRTGEASDTDIALFDRLTGATTPLEREQKLATLEETRRRTEQIGIPTPPTPTQQIAQEKLNRIKLLQEQESGGTITPPLQAELNTLRGGSAPVQITFGQPASAAERTAIAKTRASVDALDNLKTLFDSPRTQAGPIVGRTSPLAGLVGMTTDEQESFMAATSAFKNQVIKDITGAQMSEVEAKRIMKQIPDITDPPTRWRAKWEQTKKNLQSIQKRREEVLRQSGIRVPEGTSRIGLPPEQQVTTITNQNDFNKLRPGTEYIFEGQRFIKGQ